MKVYSVSPCDGAIEGEAFFTNKAAAFACARAIANAGTEATVCSEIIRGGKGRDLMVALLNRVGWSGETEVVKVFPAKKVTIE